MDILLLIVSAVSAVLACKIILSVYRYYILWKKLNRIPGPPALPIIGTLELRKLIEGEERLKWFLTFLNRFKDGIVAYWTGPTPAICLYDPNLIQVILSSNVHINKPYHMMLLSDWLGDGLLTAVDEQWHKDRKLLTPTFHFNILEQFALTMSERTEMMIESLEEKVAKNPQQAINIVSCITQVTTDIILETAMGVTSFETLSEYRKALNRYVSLYFTRLNNWIYLILDALGPIYSLLPIARQTKAAVTHMHNLANEIIQKRKLARNLQKSKNVQNGYDASDKSRRKVFLDLLLELKDNDNTSLSDKKVRAQVDTFLFAGHDTTKTSICWTLFCIGNYLTYQEKIHEELEIVFKDSQKPATVKELSQLKYLDRVIKESRRLYSTVPHIVRKLSDNTKIGDYTIPKNTRINISMLLLHRNPAIWPDPLKCDPGRFLPENIRSMHPYAYIPFSAGPRNYIELKYAMLEEKSILRGC